jgi:tetratricopeptide (TPR) repeat protein
LWDAVKKAEAAGKSMGEVQTQLSLENEFAFVKDMQVYKDNGDEWVRPQHQSHVRVFYLQHKNLASEILKKEMDNPLEEAIARVKKMHKAGDDIYFDEWSINDLGYKLINSERFKESIEVLKLNVEVFPESANAYDSLAEAYMQSGDDANAIKFYRKSLELNPENNNAKEMLKTLAEK